MFIRAAGEGVVKHYHIKKTNTGQFYLTEDHMFDTLPELVVFHKHEINGENFIDSNHVCRESYTELQYRGIDDDDDDDDDGDDDGDDSDY